MRMYVSGGRMPTGTTARSVADAYDSPFSGEDVTCRDHDCVRRPDPRDDQTLTTAITASLGLTAVQALIVPGTGTPDPADVLNYLR